MMMVTIPILLLVFVIGMNWLLKKDAKKEVFGTRTSASSVITSPDRNNNQTASSSSRLNVNSTQASSNSKVNTKDLTTEQVKKWVTYSIYSIEHEHATIENIEVSMRDDGLVYAVVRLTDKRLNSGLSRTYRISSEGYLEEESGFSGWKIISKDYHE
ncbi:hypothetical protein [Streptococcus sciuri]|uniref:Tim44-like domain-containing protein n=1 Tax=Streptococcus sciuri TaxID=2973939 RepID=A0ABT2F5M9_9STRE|nr:hypothetical protein [Streptococcus sciuri]MCS4487749.1 hypothetical protein [Streptococcus sciuri]